MRGHLDLSADAQEAHWRGGVNRQGRAVNNYTGERPRRYFHRSDFCVTPLTGLLKSENSTDLDMGRRPKLKSDEFSDFSKQVGEIFSHLCLKPPKQVVQSLAA